MDAAKNLLCSKQELDAKGIDYVETNRGGDITYHGPEQIVGYSIISLLERQDLHRYLRDLEQVLINTLESLGLAAQHRKGLTGIWLKNRKVAAIGVSVKSWISYHGFALNVNNDLSPFSDIIPCGIAASQGSVSSLKIELKKEIDLSEIKKLIANEWQHIFC